MHKCEFESINSRERSISDLPVGFNISENISANTNFPRRVEVNSDDISEYSGSPRLSMHKNLGRKQNLEVNSSSNRVVNPVMSPSSQRNFFSSPKTISNDEEDLFGVDVRLL